MQELPLPVGLENEDIRLRSWTPADVLSKASWAHDKEVTRWTGVSDVYCEDTALDYINSLEDRRLRGVSVDMAIEDKRTGTVIGSCDVRRPFLADTEIGELGYIVVEEARGRGIASLAITWMTAYAFECGFKRVQALVHPNNHASIKVLERAGLQYEGLLRQYRPGKNGQREDRVVYAATN